MKAVVISKIPLLKQCRAELRLVYGLIDFDNLIDCLCLGIEGRESDRKYIRDMVYGDVWNNGHQIPYDEHQKARLVRILHGLRGAVVRAIHSGGHVPHHLHFRYLPRFTSAMSLTFEVF